MLKFNSIPRSDNNREDFVPHLSFDSDRSSLTFGCLVIQAPVVLPSVESMSLDNAISNGMADGEAQTFLEISPDANSDVCSEVSDYLDYVAQRGKAFHDSSSSNVGDSVSE